MQVPLYKSYNTQGSPEPGPLRLTAKILKTRDSNLYGICRLQRRFCWHAC